MSPQILVVQDVIFSPPRPKGTYVVFADENPWDKLSLREFADLTTLRSLYVIPTQEEDWVLSICEAFAGSFSPFCATARKTCKGYISTISS